MEDPRILIAQQRDLAAQYGQQAARHGRAAAIERGQWFNDYLADLLRLHGIDAHSNQHGLEQRDEIDVYFRLGGNALLVENKWTTKKLDVTSGLFDVGRGGVAGGLIGVWGGMLSS